jgi:hypothetical protein
LALSSCPQEVDVNITELTHPGIAGCDVGWVQWELFVFRDIRDVLSGSRPDTVLVVHRGPARVEDWTDALVRSGLLGEWSPTPSTS